MIKAEDFFNLAFARGYRSVAGVPCSFLTPIINYCIDNQKFDYVSAANEGDAVAIAAGATLGGKKAIALMQNSGLGNAVNPITSLLYTFKIPLLLLITLRGDPDLKDEPQHELMGKITGSLLDSMKVNWEYFPTNAADIDPALHRAEAFMNENQLPYAFVVRKGSVAPEKLQEGTSTLPSPRKVGQIVNSPVEMRMDPPNRTKALEKIIEFTKEPNVVVIATTGYTGRELFAIVDRSNHFYMVGSMGCASSLGLGLSLARPDLKVVVIDGDGAALMRMGNFATLGAYGRNNLIHILLDNGIHDSTGGQTTTAPGLSFARIASDCGYGECFEGSSLNLLDDLFMQERDELPIFGHIRIRQGTPESLPRPSLSPREVKIRLMKTIQRKSK